MKQRIASVKMLHIGLRGGWAVRDVWFVLTGSAFYPWERGA